MCVFKSFEPPNLRRKNSNNQWNSEMGQNRSFEVITHHILVIILSVILIVRLKYTVLKNNTILGLQL